MGVDGDGDGDGVRVGHSMESGSGKFAWCDIRGPKEQSYSSHSIHPVPPSDMSDSPPSYSYQRSAAPISSSKMEEFYPTSSSSERTARALAAAQQSSQREDYRERERERERGYGPARTLADLELRRGFDDTGGLGGLSGGIGGLEGDTIWEDIQANIGEQLLGGGGGGGGGGAGVGTGAGQGSGDIEDIDMENVNIPEGYILVPGNKAPQSGKAPKSE